MFDTSEWCVSDVPDGSLCVVAFEISDPGPTAVHVVKDLFLFDEVLLFFFFSAGVGVVFEGDSRESSNYKKIRSP